VELEPELVKLDMSMIRDVDRSSVKQGLVRAMTGVSKEMGLLVVAEGIETEAERDTVIELGVDLLQGYRFGKPSRNLEEPAW
jgi:EAL domain-containing protein (putative c-di-GMP-specific phosphodiesterase class I)